MKELTRFQSVRRNILINMPYELLSFLIKNKALSEFIDNCTMHIISCNISINVYIILADPMKAFDFAFIWKHTSEGYTFWKYLRDQYLYVWEKKLNR